MSQTEGVHWDRGPRREGRNGTVRGSPPLEGAVRPWCRARGVQGGFQTLGARRGPGGRGRPPPGEGRGRRPRPPHPVAGGSPAAPAAPDPPALPVLAGRDDAVLLGDEKRGRDRVLVPLDLAQQHRAAALRPGVDLGRHVRTAAAAAAAASRAGDPSADGRAGGDAPVPLRLPGPRGRRAAVSSRVLPPRPVLPGEAAQPKTPRPGESRGARLRTSGKVRKVEK